MVRWVPANEHIRTWSRTQLAIDAHQHASTSAHHQHTDDEEPQDFSDTCPICKSSTTDVGDLEIVVCEQRFFRCYAEAHMRCAFPAAQGLPLDDWLCPCCEGELTDIERQRCVVLFYSCMYVYMYEWYGSC